MPSRQFPSHTKLLNLDRIHGLRSNFHSAHFMAIIRGLFQLQSPKTYRPLRLANQSRQSLAIRFIHRSNKSFLPKHRPQIIQGILQRLPGERAELRANTTRHNPHQEQHCRQISDAQPPNRLHQEIILVPSRSLRVSKCRHRSPRLCEPAHPSNHNPEPRRFRIVGQIPSDEGCPTLPPLKGGAFAQRHRNSPINPESPTFALCGARGPSCHPVPPSGSAKKA